MTYEKFKTGMFRVFVFLTIVVMIITIGITDGGSDEPGLLVLFPVILWIIYFFGLWIAKGFIGKK